jgi:phosphoenolpyruvate carboxykinase (ATP)
MLMGELPASAAALAASIAAGARVQANLRTAVLFETAISRGEARVATGGALAATTGVHTGRSPKDKFIVRDNSTRDRVWWQQNQAIEPAAFDALLQDFLRHAASRELFAQDLFAGADPKHRISVTVFTELAWHSQFIRNLLIRPELSDLVAFQPRLTIVDLPSFKADPKRHGVRSETVIAVDFARGMVLIGGTGYAGEIKKSVFTYLNYAMPNEDVMPMHCSANVGREGDAAILFGLSGTGKTTLSADPNRPLIGDDEHGWGANGVFNFEGGCYAKTIRLSAEAEPAIYAAVHRFGSVLENVMIDPATREPDFDDFSLTENGRGGYPLDFIENADRSGRAGHPGNVIMLTCDAFGVMPPIAKLTSAQAMYHFLSGYTAKVAGTEKGVTEPEATFSTCFGAPFMPRHPFEYGAMLAERIRQHGAQCWLLNTGWTGGPFGVGRRMPIATTRALLTGALNGSLARARFAPDAVFGFEVPVSVPGVDTGLLNPRSTWSDGAAYDRQAAKLAEMFVKNFDKFGDAKIDPEVKKAAPRLGQRVPA